EIEDSLSERILFNELKSGQKVVVDCEGDPTDIENSKLVFRGSVRETPADAEVEATPVAAAPTESAA
ncbi:MAG: hypothetical protein HOU81_03190, partial [Hamadaea sp.]|nr:hypothetical protein [Hamadaea sp.]